MNSIMLAHPLNWTVLGQSKIILNFFRVCQTKVSKYALFSTFHKLLCSHEQLSELFLSEFSKNETFKPFMDFLPSVRAINRLSMQDCLLDLDIISNSVFS